VLDVHATGIVAVAGQPVGDAPADRDVAQVDRFGSEQRRSDGPSLRPRTDVEPVFGGYGGAVLFATVSSSQHGWATLSVTGDCDLASGPELRRQIQRAAADADRLVVDLAGVGFLDSVGLGLLVGAARRVQELVVVAPEGSSARRALESSRLTEILDVRATFDPT
jgi:anti-sigma B factor antagonist